ncbi:MAG: cytidylate kinase family protein [Candidatus Binataceae bacterium]
MTQHLGTRAADLGRLTAARLGYRFLMSPELIAETSQLYHVTPEQLVVVDERRPHFWERLKTDSERFLTFFRAVVLKEMAKNDLVVIGRSVAHLLPDYGCGIRVRLTAPMKDRIQQIAVEEKLAPAVAERRVRDYDREVRARLQTLLGVDIDDPANFSLVLNTSAMPLQTLAAALAGCAEAIDSQTGPEQWRQMRDAALSAQVRAALMFHPKIGHAPLEVQCDGGSVHVNGPGLVPPWDDLVNDVVRQIDGVKAVEIVAEEQPSPVRPT